MKEKFLHGVTVTRILIASYCGLLVIVALIRYKEYQETRQAVVNIDAVSKKASQKQALLLSISQRYANDQKIISEYIHPGDVVVTNGVPPAVAATAAASDRFFATYQQLIRTKGEQQAFNELQLFHKATAQLNDSFLLAVAGNTSVDAYPHFAKKKIDANARFHAAVHKLQHLVSEESQVDIAGASQQIIVLARRKELGSYVVIFLMLVLGLAIGNALKKLRRTENKYRLLFDNSALAKCLVDPTSFRILDVNNASLALYGYSRTELLQMTAFGLRRLEAQALEGVEAEFRKLVEAGSTFSAKATHYKKNNEQVEVDINAHSIFAGDKRVLLVTVQDITERERTEKRIAGAIIQTQEDERRKFGSDLHDNVGQILVSTQLYLSMAANKDYGDPEKFIAVTQKYLTMAIDETRNMSHSVFPAFLEEIPLQDAIDHLLEGMNPGGEMAFNFEYDSVFLTELFHPDLKLHFYRILQEQLKNIQKYSQATAVQIELRKSGNHISLQVADNGIGFDATTLRPGIGLLNMKKRAEILFGRFLLKTAPGEGCSVMVEVPVGEGR